MRSRRIALTLLFAVLTVGSLAQPGGAQTSESGAGAWGADRDTSGVRLNAGASNTGASATVGAHASVRVDDLQPVDTGGEGPSYLGPAAGGADSAAGGPVAPPPVIACRYEPTGRTDAAGRIEMAVMCGGRALGVYDNSRTMWVSPADPATAPAPGPAPVLVDPAVLAASARSMIVFPAPVPRSSPGVEEGTYARLPTAFWVEGWAPVSESATAGPVTATVTARPLRQEWTVHDGLRGTSETVSCDGQGEAVTAGSDAEPACGWTPTHSSAGQPSVTGSRGEACFATTVTVTWAVTWGSTLGPGGSLGTGTSSADTCLIVAEIQAVVTGAP